MAEANEGAQSPLEDAELIDWTRSGPAKYRFLRALYDLFMDGAESEGPLGTDFANFRAAGGAMLEQHARFEALHGSMPSREDWRSWPIDLRDPGSAAVTAFAEAHGREVRFHMFGQWLADRSIRNAQQAALSSGMRIGLIGDFPVGMDPGGSHVWSRQSDVLLGLTIGAPPDLLNPMGQSWGLTNFSPRALVDRGFAPFIETMRAAMRNAGGVRIDHAMGLARLWLVPEGASPADGAFLNFPMTDLLRLIALESARQDAVVIGEDLGTVPPGFSQALEQAGIHGMRVLWFERDQAGFSEASAWQRSAIAMTSTHDLPTVAGWWKGSDLRARHEHGRLGNNLTLEKLEEERVEDRKLLWERLVTEGMVEGDPPPEDNPEPVVDGVLKYVCSTDSVLCLIPLEDLIGQEEQPNLPGTVDEHPNWRRRLPVEAAHALEGGDVERRVEIISSLRPHR
jgi:4-alpha-glucanotransferase